MLTEVEITQPADSVELQKLKMANEYIIFFHSNKIGNKVAESIKCAEAAIALLRTLKQQSYETLYLCFDTATELSRLLFKMENNKYSRDYTGAYCYAKISRENLEEWTELYYEKYYELHKSSVDSTRGFVDEVARGEKIFIKFKDLFSKFKADISKVKVEELLNYLAEQEGIFEDDGDRNMRVCKRTFADLEYIISNKYVILHPNQLVVARFLRTKLSVYMFENQKNALLSNIENVDKLLVSLEDAFLKGTFSLEDCMVMQSIFEKLEVIFNNPKFMDFLQRNKERSAKYEAVFLKIENILTASINFEISSNIDQSGSFGVFVEREADSEENSGLQTNSFTPSSP